MLKSHLPNSHWEGKGAGEANLSVVSGVNHSTDDVKVQDI